MHRVIASVLVIGVVAGCGSDASSDSTSGSTAPPPSSATAPPSTPTIPDRPPDVTGRVAYDTGYPADMPNLFDPSDSYFDGMSLMDGGTVVHDEHGREIAITEFGDGDVVAVWTDGMCAESFPVQCGIVAIEILERAAPAADTSPTPAAPTIESTALAGTVITLENVAGKEVDPV